MSQGNTKAAQAAENPIDAGVLGFDVVAEARDVPGWGTTEDIPFVSVGGYHHQSEPAP